MTTRTTLLRTCVLLGAAAFAVAGCTTPRQHVSRADRFDHDYTLRHPIIVSETPHFLDIPVGPRTRGLSPELEEMIASYLRGYRRHGTGGLTVQVPAGSANQTAAEQVAAATREEFRRAGIAPSLVFTERYAASPAVMAPVRISYLRVQAKTPQCGMWPKDLKSRSDNGQYYNFGCSAQNNLAAMVQNPADLVRPRDMAPAVADRRAVAIDLYRNGQ